MYKELLAHYEARFPQEQAGLQPLHDLLDEHDDQTVMSRRHFDDGHITASGFVLNPALTAVLLIDHRFLEKQIQPGGHMETSDSDPLAGVYRELAEEVSLEADDLRYLPLDAQQPLVPLDIDIHPFPPRPEKEEPAHAHYDFRYLFALRTTTKIRLLTEEVTGAHWVELATLANQPDFVRQTHKIQRAITTQA